MDGVSVQLAFPGFFSLPSSRRPVCPHQQDIKLLFVRAGFRQVDLKYNEWAVYTKNKHCFSPLFCRGIFFVESRLSFLAYGLSGDDGI